jgi:tetratricopeptide (TPR) repeat protein
MGNDVRRDHSFRVPRPDQSVTYGTPNACTSCHAGKKAEWASAAVAKWYGPKRAYHFSDDLLPGSLLDERSAGHLIRLLADTLQPAIARATAAHYLGSLLTEPSLNALTRALRDDEAMIRYQSLRALVNFPASAWQSHAAALLRDKVRAVRIAAADLYHRAGGLTMVPAGAQAAYRSANEENVAYLSYQADFSAGNVMLGDYYLQGQEHLNAIRHYVRALKKDSLMNYARLNLSVAYSAAGRNEEALRTLREAEAVDHANGRVHYSMALLYNEMGNSPEAILQFEKALSTDFTEPGLYYNYGLLLAQSGRTEDSEQVLLNGFRLYPRAANINFALAHQYYTGGRLAEARRHAAILRELDPGNPDYQDLIRALGF